MWIKGCWGHVMAGIVSSKNKLFVFQHIVRAAQNGQWRGSSAAGQSQDRLSLCSSKLLQGPGDRRDGRHVERRRWSLDSTQAALGSRRD